MLAQLASDPRVAEAVARLAAWDQMHAHRHPRRATTPTTTPGQLREPTHRGEAQHRRDDLLGVAQPVPDDTLVATLRQLPFNPVGRSSGGAILSAARNLLDKL